MAKPSLFSFDEILSWKNCKMLENGDLFKAITNEEDYEEIFSVVYLDNKWFKVVNQKLVEVSEKELKDFNYRNENICGSPYQEFIKRKGKEEFEKLSDEDKCDVYSDEYMSKHINYLLDGALNAIQKANKLLEEDK